MSVLIAIEGIDGSGKGTQAARLHRSMQDAGCRSHLFSFPRYRETQFGHKIGDYLNGRFGSLEQVSPFLVSLLFAGDRFESRDVLARALAENDVVICDRYVASNVAHQTAKADGDERDELIEWIHFVEHQLYALPRPSQTVFLDLPVAQASRLIALKAQRTYTDRAADLQEADGEYLQKVHNVYTQLSASDQTWAHIKCLDDGNLKSVDQIADEVWQSVTRVMGFDHVDV